MIYYALVFFASLLVDLLPFIGPPAWTVMVYFQIQYGLDIWWVLATGVLGSTLGRYILSLYMPLLSEKIISAQKKEDIEFVGKQLKGKTGRVRLFVLLYTLVPLPSTPLFTAAGIARINAKYILPSFIVGKFISDMLMVLSGDYAARNAIAIANGFFTWKSVLGLFIGLLIIVLFFGIDWRALLQNKKIRFNFKIWK
jgi:membrane protein YqaA with SNARE-associated domain